MVDGVLDNVRAMNICERDQELVHKFEELSQLHKKNMMSGHQRQVPKRRLDKSNFRCDTIPIEFALNCTNKYHTSIDLSTSMKSQVAG